MKTPTDACCIICGEKIKSDDPVVTSKRRKGPTIYIHTACYEKEQAELKEARKA